MSRYLVTGGTGSLGRLLISTLLEPRMPAEWVASYSRDEVKAHALAQSTKDPRLRVFLGDVRDVDRLRQACHNVHTVVHAAALKRVTESVYSPGEVINTNVFGTMRVIQAAVECGVKRVLVISSDKAVRPTNLYGVTKAAAEAYSVQSNSFAFPQGTRVSCVRYGNVLGSRGSVLQDWYAAAKRGEPLPLTDPRMTRFWLTLRQAMVHVLVSLDTMTGGEIFLPRLDAASLLQVGEAIWSLVPDAPQRWENIGLRPGGEKLHEELLSPDEVARTYWLERLGVYAVVPSYATWAEPWWRQRPGWILVPSDFTYTSDAARPLGVQALKSWIQNFLEEHCV